MPGNSEASLMALHLEHAERVLDFIERHVSQMVVQTWQAVALLFDEDGTLGPEPLNIDRDDAPASPVRFHHLERYAPQWAVLVPAEPGDRAALARMLAEKHDFSYEAGSRTRR